MHEGRVAHYINSRWITIQTHVLWLEEELVQQGVNGDIGCDLSND